MNYVNMWKWKLGLAAVVVIGLPLCAAAMQWPDTGQRNCYDNEKIIPCPVDESSPFFGQDAQYDGLARSYTKIGQHGGPMTDEATEWIIVEDNVTGLMWELKDNMDGTPDYTNLHDADNGYTWCERGINAGFCDDENNTENFINAINAEMFGGYTGWRLPTVQELVSLIDLAKVASRVDTQYFKLTFANEHWTADKDFSSNDLSWSVTFNDVSKNMQTNLMPVRAVRSGP